MSSDPNKEDGGIWADYAKGVKRIKRVTKPKPPSRHSRESGDPAPEISVRKNADSSSVSSGRWMPASAGMTAILDRRMEKKLRDGDIRIEARLDMHGMRQTEAHAALADFIAKAVKAGARNLLVITGKGKADNGVLKTNFMGWLENLPEALRILAVRPAAIKHGGSGAFYVILRKPV